MATRRDTLQDSGMTCVQTYLQSGNVVFQSDIGTEVSVSNFMFDIIMSKFEMNVPVIVRSPDELRDVIRLNPFGEHAAQSPSLVRVFFLREAPTQDRVRVLSAEGNLRCDWQVSARHVYISYRSAEEYQAGSTPFIAKTLDVEGTERNWRTVSVLGRICS